MADIANIIARGFDALARGIQEEGRKTRELILAVAGLDPKDPQYKYVIK